MNEFESPIYIVNERLVDRELNSINKPEYRSKFGGLFAYESGHFIIDSSVRGANGFSNADELVRALNYANNGRLSSRMVPAYMHISFTQTSIDVDEVVRQSALSKLNDQEKRALGITD